MHSVLVKHKTINYFLLKIPTIGEVSLSILYGEHCKNNTTLLNLQFYSNKVSQKSNSCE